jgi:hypothetical protein
MAGYQSFQRAVTLLAGHSLRLQSSLAVPLRPRDEIMDPWMREERRRHHLGLDPF